MYSSLERIGATDAVVQRIQELILENRLRSGEALPPERELAERFGVGRNVVREALRILGEKGLVQVLSGRGTFVAEADPSGVSESLRLLLRRRRVTLAELSDARLLVEPELAALAARNATQENTLELRAWLARLEEANGDAEAHVEADLGLHGEIARLSNQPVFQAIVEAVRDVLHTSMRLGITMPEAVGPSDERHRRIVAAIVAGDSETARREMREHMLSVAEYQRPKVQQRARRSRRGETRES